MKVYLPSGAGAPAVPTALHEMGRIVGSVADDRACTIFDGARCLPFAQRQSHGLKTGRARVSQRSGLRAALRAGGLAP